MIPFYKVLALFLKVLSKPIISYTQKYHSSRESHSQVLRLLFIYLGNFHHRISEKINRKFLKIQIQFAYKPLQDQIAIKRGVQFFYEILLYATLVGAPMYQLYMATKESAEKSAEVDRKLKAVEEESVLVLQRLVTIQNTLKQEEEEEAEWRRMHGKWIDIKQL